MENIVFYLQKRETGERLTKRERQTFHEVAIHLPDRSDIHDEAQLELNLEYVREENVEAAMDDIKCKQNTRCLRKRTKERRAPTTSSSTESDDEGERIINKKLYYIYEKSSERLEKKLWQITERIDELEDTFDMSEGRINMCQVSEGLITGYIKDNFGKYKDRGVSKARKVFKVLQQTHMQANNKLEK